MLPNKVSYLQGNIYMIKFHREITSHNDELCPKILYNYHQRYIKTALVSKVEISSNNVKCTYKTF